MKQEEGEHVKEVFAQFGRALYLAQVLEHGIVNALVAFTLLPTRAGVKSASEWVGKVDLFMDREFERTLGGLIRRLREDAPVSPDLAQELMAARDKRNWLAHGFFRERALEFMSSSGRVQMIDEIEECRNMFEQADRSLNQPVQIVYDSHGISAKMIQTAYAAMFDRAKCESD